MPNTRIQKTIIPNVELNTPKVNSSISSQNINTNIKDNIPNASLLSKFSAVIKSTASGISAGMPIGLLLSLTYSADPGPTIENIIGEKPNVNIK